MKKNCKDCRFLRKEYGEMYCRSCYDSGGKAKDDKKRTVTKNAKRFFKKFGYRMLSKMLELATLFALGYALGLKLIRY